VLLPLIERRFGIWRRIGQLQCVIVGVEAVVEWHLGGFAPRRACAVGDVANDLQEPSFRVAAPIGVEIDDGAQHRILNHVLSPSSIAEQPARQIVGGIEMRQDGLLERCGRPLITGLFWQRQSSGPHKAECLTA
jgi:hypothetical protein